MNWNRITLPYVLIRVSLQKIVINGMERENGVVKMAGYLKRQYGAKFPFYS